MCIETYRLINNDPITKARDSVYIITSITDYILSISVGKSIQA